MDQAGVSVDRSALMLCIALEQVQQARHRPAPMQAAGCQPAGKPQSADGANVVLHVTTSTQTPSAYHMQHAIKSSLRLSELLSMMCKLMPR